MTVEHHEWSAIKTRYFVYVVVALLISLFMWWSAPKVIYKPQGIALPATKTSHLVKEASVANVQVIQASSAVGQTLATIHVEVHASEQSQQAERDVLDYAKKLAAKQGANTLAIEQFGFAPSANYSGLSIYILTAKAVKQEGQMSILPMEPSLVLPN